MAERLGLIAGNGKFPFLVLEAARAKGYEVVVAAIKEETSPEIEKRGAVAVLGADGIDHRFMLAHHRTDHLGRPRTRDVDAGAHDAVKYLCIFRP